MLFIQVHDIIDHFKLLNKMKINKIKQNATFSFFAFIYLTFKFYKNDLEIN